MKPENRKLVIVPMQGGLGNQLFQLVFAMAYGYPGNSYLEIDKTDKVNFQKYEQGLVHFKLPEHISVLEIRSRTRIFYHLRNFLTRMSTNPRGFFGNSLTRSGEILLKTFSPNPNTRRAKILTSKGIGFDPSLIPAEAKKARYVIGYFQSYKWFQNPGVKSAIRDMSLIVESEVVNSYARIAMDERPLIIHLRFGDYLEDKTFQVQTDYYNLALHYLRSKFKISNVWIFSDDENRAKNILQIDYDIQVRWIVGDSILPHEVFEIMRYGTSFIISNSTFSYWAAQMSHSDKPLVIAPVNWFQSRTEPLDLCPEDWIRI
jgi:hypothetical protein